MGETFKRPDIVEFFGLFHTKPGQDGDFNLALACITRMILQDFNRHNLICSMLPTFDHLAERATAQEFEHFVP